MTQYATGKHAKAQCDRCGFVVPYLELKEQVIDSKLSGLRVCCSCLDPDQPQWRIRDVRVDDAQGLRNPRPFRGVERSAIDAGDVV